MISPGFTKPLTSFQEAFCLQFIKTGNASQAYRTVSVRSRAWKAETVWRAAARIMSLSKVGTRIKELRAGMAERAMVTAESLAAELDELIAKAVALGHSGVAVSAVMGKAKLFGLLVGRKETRKGLLDDLPFDQLRILQEVLATLEYAEPTDEAT